MKLPKGLKSAGIIVLSLIVLSVVYFALEGFEDTKVPELVEIELPSDFPEGIVPIYENSIVYHTVECDGNGFFIFGRTEDSVEDISNYYEEMLDMNESICLVDEKRYRLLGMKDGWYYFVTTWKDWLVETYDSRLRIDVAVFPKIQLEDSESIDKLFAPGDMIGICGTNASFTEMVNFYVGVDNIKDVQLINDPSGEAIIDIGYESGHNVMLSRNTMNGEVEDSYENLINIRYDSQ